MLRLFSSPTQWVACVARRYVSHEGGAANTRQGDHARNPIMGVQLRRWQCWQKGPPAMLGPFGEALRQTVLSFPAVHQLLPSYACYRWRRGHGVRAHSPLAPSIRHDRRNRELEEIEAADPDAPSRRHAIIGERQTTKLNGNAARARVATARSPRLEATDLGGDGAHSPLRPYQRYPSRRRRDDDRRQARQPPVQQRSTATKSNPSSPPTPSSSKAPAAPELKMTHQN